MASNVGCGRVRFTVATGSLQTVQGRKFVSAADMDHMSPQERADAVDASICTSWDEVPEPFRSEVLTELQKMARLEHDD
jgi:hypothetical protein